MADRYLKATGNYDAVATWSATDGGAAGASVPGSGDNVHFTANSNGLTLTVNVASNCIDFVADADNTATVDGASTVNITGDVTWGASMTNSKTGAWAVRGSSKSITSAGVTWAGALFHSGSGSYTLQDAFTSTGYVELDSGTLDTNGQAVSCTYFLKSSATAATLTLGASTFTTSHANGWTYSGSTLTVTANTATIIITGTGALVGGAVNWNGADFELNGTAHLVTGAFTCATLTRNGTATKTDSVTFGGGVTFTCTTFAMKGNAVYYRLLVQSNADGTPATITATNWTGSQHVDIMDITATNAVDLSAITGDSGDCQGNTNITFTTPATQTWDNGNNNWDNAGSWTSRIPLPQDDVVVGGGTVAVNMTRIGKNITFTGTPTATKSNAIDFYGSLTLASGMTWTGNKIETFRGRGSYTITTAGKTLYRLYMEAPSGTLTVQDDSILENGSDRMYLIAGTLDANDNDITMGAIHSNYSSTRGLVMGSGTWTLGIATATTKWNFATTTGLTFDAETSTLVLTNSGANAQTFSGGGLTYNNVTVAGAGDYDLTISGDNTYNIFTVDRSEESKTLTITPASTQTFAEFKCPVKGVYTLTLETGGATATFAMSGTAVFKGDYVDLTDILGSAASDWYYGVSGSVAGTTTNWTAGDYHRYWVGNDEDWSDEVNSWSDSSGGAAGSTKPDATINAIFDSNSFGGGGQTCTVDEIAYCYDMDFSQVTNTPDFSVTGSYYLLFSGSVTLGTMTMAFVGGSVHGITFVGSGSETFTSAGVDIGCRLTINGTGTLTLQDALSVTSTLALSIQLNAGTLATGGNTITTAGRFSVTGTSTTLTPSSSTINCVGWVYSGSGFTLTANTSTIIITGTDVFYGGAITTYNDIQLNGTTHTTSGSFTCANLTRTGTATATDSLIITNGTTITCTGTFTATGNSTTNRLSILTDSATDQATINCAVEAVTKCDLKDIIGAGAASWEFGASDDNLQVSNCTDIIFRLYWIGDTDNWSTLAAWASVSGGAEIALAVPDANTSVYFDASSFSGASQTCTVDATATCYDMDWTGQDDTPTLSLGSNDIDIYGAICTFISAMVVTGTTGQLDFQGDAVCVLTTNTVTVQSRIRVYRTGAGGVTLADALTMGSNHIYHRDGTFDTGNFDITFTGSGGYLSPYTTSRTLTLGSSTFTVNDFQIIATSFTLTANTATIKIIGTGDFEGGGLTAYNIVELNGSAHTVDGSNTFSRLALPPATTQTITFTDGTTQTVSSIALSGDSTHQHTLTGTSTAGWALTSSVTSVWVKYCTIDYSTVGTKSWYAMTNMGNVDGGNNTGWRFDNIIDGEGSADSVLRFVPPNLRSFFKDNRNRSNGKNPYGFSTVGLVLYLPFWALQNNVAFQSIDVYGSTCDVTTAIWTPSGREFTSATPDYIEVTCPQCNFIGEDFSLVARLKVTDVSARRWIFTRGITNTDGWDCYFENTGRFAFETCQATSQQTQSSVGSIVNGNMYTVGFSRVGTAATIYINGADDTNSAETHIDPLTSARTAKIGVYDNKTGYPYGGLMSDILVYNRALSAGEHAEIHNSLVWRA